MNASSLRTASMCGGTPTPSGAAPVAVMPPASLARRRAAPDTDSYYNNNNGATSRRPSQCYSEISSVASHRHQRQHHHQHGTSASGGGGAGNGARHQQWTSYRTDVTGTSIRTPVSSGKFRTNFSFRRALVPEGYPKMDHERNPRRESFVAEFSRKLAEGYDIWEDEDRPVINWVFPRLPIRKNKTHELRMMANRERITKMLEREKQMNKRNTRLPHSTAGADKRETAWWERSRNGVNRTPASHAGGHAAAGTPRASGQTNRGWSSHVGASRPNYAASKGSFYGPRR